MVLFCPPSRARLEAPASDWLVLGKEASLPARLEERLGRPPRALGGLLNEEARRLKGPFLELTARLGKGADAASWWAGTLPGKAWDASDLFLLCCYLGVSWRLAAGGGSLTVVVEDPWLLCQLEEALAGSPSARVDAPRTLVPMRLQPLLLGLARRLKWASRTAWGRLRQEACWRGRPGGPRMEGVLIYSHLTARSLQGEEGWEDPFLPGLDKELSEDGVPSARLVYSDSTGFEPQLARRKAAVLPAILWASWGGFFDALAALPPSLPPRADLSGLPVGRLLEREWWHDFSRAGRCAYRLFLDCVRALLAEGRFRAVVMPWEAQPQERMLVLAAKAAGVRSVGYQHTTVPEFQLPFFSTEREYLESPLPDVLLTSGEQPARVLREAGFPAGRLKVGGTRRYAHLLKDGAPPALPPNGNVLVVLPIDPFHARHLTAALERAYPRGLPGGEFLLRPHPSGPEDVRRTRLRARLAEGPMSEALAACGVVVFTGSTAGLDALAAGRPVLRYRPERLLDVEPTDMFPDGEIPTASDADLRERLEGLRKAPPEGAPEALRSRLRQVFSRLDRAAWRGAVLG